MLKFYFKWWVLSFSPTPFCRCFPGTLLLSSQYPCNCWCTLYSLTKHKFLKNKDYFLRGHIPRANPNKCHGGDTLYIISKCLLKERLSECIDGCMDKQLFWGDWNSKSLSGFPTSSWCQQMTELRVSMLPESAIGRIAKHLECLFRIQFSFHSPSIFPDDEGPCVISAFLGPNFDMQTRFTFLNASRSGEHLAILVSITTTNQTTASFVDQTLC